ncbi:MAG: flagellar brake protein [Sterolibacterium sp.]|nr:flagellar brake protein [Sterolibacterium sp.]MBP9798894.1 flagellar brake protein [Sterolibacterium sp.]
MTESKPDHTATSAPGKFEPVRQEAGQDYFLRTRIEILGVLNTMAQQGTMMTAYFNQGRDFMMTAVLRVIDEKNALVLDASNDAEMNRHFQQADKVICVSNLDRIKIQFVLGGVRAVQFEGRSAFVAAIPQALMRLQRRNDYRVSLPTLQPLAGVIQLPRPQATPLPVEVNVTDISGGGVGFVTKSYDVELSSGMVLPGCRINLPGVGVITVDLRVCSLGTVTAKNGTRHKRAGCQFENIDGKMHMSVQRFILKLEREQSARESGLG